MTSRYVSRTLGLARETDSWRVQANGGTYVHARQAWGEEVVVDRNGGILITGANPASATATGEALVAALKK